MSLIRQTILVLMLLALTSCFLSEATAQEKPDSEQQLAMRVQSLEKRIDHLERLIFSTAQLSVYDAQRRLENAEIQLAQSRRLLLKGAMRRHELAHDEFLVQRAKRELDLARATEGQFRITCEIDLMQAEQNLRLAKQNLDHNRNLLSKGYVSAEKISQLQIEVDDALKARLFAENKLKNIQRPDAADSSKETRSKPATTTQSESNENDEPDNAGKEKSN